MGLIQSAKNKIDDAVKKIIRYQKGLDKPILTDLDHFNENCMGGIFAGMIITIAGVSGHGKSFLLQRIEESIFNKDLNPDCDDYVLLRCNYEMSVFKLLVRRLRRSLKKSMKEVLFQEIVDEDKIRFKEVADEERNPNIFYFEEPTDPETWYNTVKEFLQGHTDKKRVVVTIDHIALIRDVLRGKKKAMDDLVEYINSLKKEFSNVSFIILSQMNREIEGRTDIRFLAPQRSDLFNSDTMYQISDIVMVVHNPYKLGRDKYMVVPGLAEDEEGRVKNSKYAYLEEFMTSPENNTTNFDTKGVIFYHYLKMREMEDVENVQDIHIERLTVNSKKKETSKSDFKPKRPEINSSDLFG